MLKMLVPRCRDETVAGSGAIVAAAVIGLSVQSMTGLCAVSVKEVFFNGGFGLMCLSAVFVVRPAVSTQAL
ncbi:hypothetical protein ACXHVK_000205 [Morganella morganii]|uniref:Uncharacterized protein n=1 Tax=Morganella morganii TaxID=582 RepID=A0A9Q4GR27_MORMO|nr:hypothetical protein [Morganella morganii]EJD6037009.1 hypothetical protein [Morganella morganii]EKW7747281.1 hypothetical protein [Morganella morganii]MCY0789959.1 hypothetical protein [Morganella morganii]